MASYRTLLMLTLLLAVNKAPGQSYTTLTGQWVNVRDSSEHLTLIANGAFRLIVHDAFNNEYGRRDGWWRYKTGLRRRLFLFFPDHLPKRYYKVKVRGCLGYTLQEVKGHTIYGRRALLPGEPLPPKGRQRDTAAVVSDREW